MTQLTQHFYMHMRHGKGGYTYVYKIVDGDKVIGWKSSGAETRKSTVKTTYTLVNGEQFFSTARELIAAYEAQKRKKEKAA